MSLSGPWIPKFFSLIYWTSFYLLNAFYFWSVAIFILHFPTNPNSFSILINLIALYFLLLYLSIQLTQTPKPIPPPILHPPLNSFESKPLSLSCKSSSFDSFFSPSTTSLSSSSSSSSSSLPMNSIPSPSLHTSYTSAFSSPSPSPCSSSYITNTTTTKKPMTTNETLHPTLSEQFIIQKLEGLTLHEKHQFFNSMYPSPSSFLSKSSSLPPPSSFHLNQPSNVSSFLIYQVILTLSLLYCFYPVVHHPSFLSTTDLYHFTTSMQWFPFEMCSTIIERLSTL